MKATVLSLLSPFLPPPFLPPFPSISLPLPCPLLLLPSLSFLVTLHVPSLVCPSLSRALAGMCACQPLDVSCFGPG